MIEDKQNENNTAGKDSEQRQVMHFCSDYKASMTSDYWQSLTKECQLNIMIEIRDSLFKKLMKAEADCRVLVLRLAGEDPETFAPETQEVMSRWMPKVVEDYMESDNENT